MTRSFSSMLLLLALATAGSATSQAAVIWNEPVNGDLSNSGLSPTSLSLGLGSNRILGSTGDSGQGVDRDYFTFTLPAGTALTSITLLNNTFVSGAFSFIGFQAGAQVTVQPSGAGGQALLGWTHYANGDIGTDILPSITATGEIPSGTYSVWVQDTGGPATYGFDFGVTPVPVPPAAILLLSGLLGSGLVRRRIAKAA